jgi:hypothetical protein
MKNANALTRRNGVRKRKSLVLMKLKLVLTSTRKFSRSMGFFELL